MFLQLANFINSLTAKMIEKGNLDGILLTGLFLFILFYNLIIQHFTFIDIVVFTFRYNSGLC